MTDDLKAPERLCYVNCGLPDDQCVCYQYAMSRDPAADRIATLEAALDNLQKAIADKGGNEHYPTEEAYLRVCAAYEKASKEREELRAALADMTQQRDAATEAAASGAERANSPALPAPQPGEASASSAPAPTAAKGGV